MTCFQYSFSIKFVKERKFYAHMQNIDSQLRVRNKYFIRTSSAVLDNRASQACPRRYLFNIYIYIYIYIYICIKKTTVSHDVQTRFHMQLAFAKFLSKIKGNF